MKKIIHSKLLPLIYCGFFLLFAHSTTYAQQTAHYNTRVSNKVNGFYDYLPPGYQTGTKKYPLYIVLQGISQLGDGSTTTLPYLLGVWGSPPWRLNAGKFPESFTVNGQTFQFIVFTPQFRYSFGGNDINDVINYCLSHYRVDETRIYISGISMGGGALWDFASSSLENAKKVAAIVPISGGGGPSQSKANVIANADLPVWATTAEMDPVVSPQATINWVKEINSAPQPPNPKAKLTVYDVNVPTHSYATAETYDPNFKENNLNIYEWMLQFTRANPVPITGLQFGGAFKAYNNEVLLKWSTVTENNNGGFVIERSNDGVTFDSLSFIKSTSISGRGASYNYTDILPLNGTNYYRIKQVDLDGKFTYSNIKVIEIKGQNQVKIFPNPVNDMLHFNANLTFTNAKLIIRDISGKLVKQLLLNGSGTVTVPVLNLPSGVYSATINQDNTIHKMTFLKK